MSLNGRKTSRRKFISLREMPSFVEQLPRFKQLGYTAAKLKMKGYPAWMGMDAGYSIEELKEGGYTARALKLAGFPKGEVDNIFRAETKK